MMIFWLIILFIVSYLVGALPVSYFAAKFFKGIDLRQYGTGQVGAGNLWRMTSWKIGIAVIIFDLGKGAVMMVIARAMGLTPGEQLIVGLAAIIGHNWPAFLRFNGGRGIATTTGVLIIAPIISNLSPWVPVVFLAIALGGLAVLHSTPVPVLLGAVAVPVTSWWLQEPTSVTIVYLAILLVIIIKRITAPNSTDAATLTRGQILLNRLLFDRDIRDRKGWMYRKPHQDKGA